MRRRVRDGRRCFHKEVIMKIGILGASTMGIGLIQICAQHGFDVVYRARRQESVDAAYDKVLANYEFMIANGWLTAEQRDDSMARITGSIDIELLKEADFVIEAASENMQTKKELFRQLDEMCRPEVILATNTSSLSVTEIASVTKRDDKVIGMHFFNPAPVMKLVEMIPGYNTSQETIDFAIDMAKKLQKTPIVVTEAPGFVVNRMLVPMINEAVSVLAEGLAKAEDIDQAMKLGANHPMGPLALADLVGLDICLSIMDVLYEEFKEPKYRANPLLRKMVRAGKLGQKTGEGFYKY